MSKGDEAAFPVADALGAGLTKRELFAAMIAQGMHASTPGCIGESVAVFAVKEADALLDALAKPKEDAK